MSRNDDKMRDGYRETIDRGVHAARQFGRMRAQDSAAQAEQIDRLRQEIASADAIVIGAGAGLSTSAGLTYSGTRFEQYFLDFMETFGIQDMYSGGFYPFPEDETKWAWWARHIYYNRYIDPPKPVYRNLLEMVKNKDYFVLTTNVDHQFQRVGFDKNRLFYTQGDYGLFQSSDPADRGTYDNEAWVMRAMEAQGFVRDSEGVFRLPEDRAVVMRIPTDCIPKIASSQRAAVMNLRADSSFVEDEGWRSASAAYAAFLDQCRDKRVLYLELGVGANTPVIVKFPFWQMTRDNARATYACINYGETFAPEEILERSICIDGDIGEVLKRLRGHAGD